MLASPFLVWLVLYVSQLLVLWFLKPDDDSLLRSSGAAIGIALVLVLTTGYGLYRFAGSLVIALSRARPLAEGEEPELERAVENLCIGAGLRPPGLYMIESAAPNAFAAGLDRERSALVVTRGLLRLLSRQELEGVVAHELAHIASRDARLKTVMAASLILVRLPLNAVVGFYRLLFRLLRQVPLAAPFVLLFLGSGIFWVVPLSIMLPGTAQLPRNSVLLAVVVFYYMGAPYYGVLVPLLGGCISRAVSRERELKADAEAVLLTRNPEGLMRALLKMSATTADLPPSAAGLSALCAVEPGRAAWFDRLFSSHPPIEARIAALAAMGTGLPPALVAEARREALEFQAVASRIAALAPEAADGYVVAAREQSAALGGSRVGDGGARLLAGAAPSAAVIAVLAKGALVTVSRDAGAYLQVITADDHVGFIDRSTPLTPVALPRSA